LEAPGRLEPKERTMNKAIAAVVALGGIAALAQPAFACPNGYEAVWIQGNKVCKIKTPKLPLKANTGPEQKKAGGQLKSR
jgi:hypothetical protein